MAEISIVIPIYKPQQQYLLALFNSIVSQEFQDFDIIISDDDEDEDLVKETLPSELQSRTKYIANHGTKGIFGNLNNAIRHAEGKFVQIFCQDDVMLPSLLSTNYKILVDNTDADITFTGFDIISQSGVITHYERKELKFIPSILEPVKSYDYFLYFGCIPGNLSPVMLTKEIFGKIGYFNESYLYGGDFDFWVRASALTKISFNKERHLLVRFHSHSASSTLGTLKRFREIKYINQFLIEHNTLPVEKKTLRRYLHRNLFRSILSYTFRQILKPQKPGWKEIIEIFDGKPYSFPVAIKAFLFPAPISVRKLKQLMEINRN